MPEMWSKEAAFFSNHRGEYKLAEYTQLSRRSAKCPLLRSVTVRFADCYSPINLGLQERNRRWSRLIPQTAMNQTLPLEREPMVTLTFGEKDERVIR